VALRWRESWRSETDTIGISLVVFVVVVVVVVAVVAVTSQIQQFVAGIGT
jgi:uncharacterized membrane protein